MSNTTRSLAELTIARSALKAPQYKPACPIYRAAWLAFCEANTALDAEIGAAKRREIFGPAREGTVRLGRQGAKQHPVSIDAEGYMRFHCACSGTANGFANHNASSFRHGAERTCRT